MTDEEMLDRAAELVGSRDYAEVQDKQGLLKKIIEERIHTLSKGPDKELSPGLFLALLQHGLKLSDIEQVDIIFPRRLHTLLALFDQKELESRPLWIICYDSKEEFLRELCFSTSPYKDQWNSCFTTFNISSNLQKLKAEDDVLKESDVKKIKEKVNEITSILIQAANLSKKEFLETCNLAEMEKLALTNCTFTYEDPETDQFYILVKDYYKITNTPQQEMVEKK